MSKPGRVSGAYRIHVGAVVLLAVVLAGCQSTPRREAPPAPAPAPVQPTPGAQRQGRPFQIDGAASLLTILVYRGGALRVEDDIKVRFHIVAHEGMPVPR